MVIQGQENPSQAYLQEGNQNVEQEICRLSRELEELKRLEEALHESEYRFSSMADGVPMMIWVTNAVGEIEFINKAYREFFGVTLTQVQSVGWRMLVHPDDTVRYVDEYLFCHEQHKPFQAQGRVYRKDGQWRWIESYGQPRFSESGAYLGMSGNSLDITERIEAEEALRESESRFHNAFQNCPIGFMMADLSGHIVDANEACCQLIGYSREELLRLEDFQLIHPRDVEKNIQLVSQLLTKDIPNFVIENRYTCKDGQAVRVRKSSSVVFSREGQPKLILSLVEQLPPKEIQ